MPNRIVISRDISPIPCEVCGWETLRVARVLSDDGGLLGQTMVCTACPPQVVAPGARRVVTGVAAGT